VNAKTSSSHKKWLPKHGRWVTLHPREVLRKNRPVRAKASLPKDGAGATTVPPTTLPVDCTGKGTVNCPMDGNDTLGICGLAMCDHMDNIRSYGQGKSGFTEKLCNLAALESQYEAVSGGDNGTDEDMLVGAQGVWTAASGGLAGDRAAVVVDHLDIDFADTALVQYCVDFFFGFCMAWSVPDAFLQQFQQGEVFAAAMTPDASNGHFTAQSDVLGPNDSAAGTALGGFYRMFTWGAWCYVSPTMIASVDPECFITFSPLQFNPAGFDSHGRHVSDVAAAWIAIGGNAALVNPVVAAFPPKVVVPPPPPPPPVSATATATFAQAVEWMSEGIKSGPPLQDPDQAIGNATLGMAAKWPAT